MLGLGVVDYEPSLPCSVREMMEPAPESVFVGRQARKQVGLEDLRGYPKEAVWRLTVWRKARVLTHTRPG